MNKASNRIIRMTLRRETLQALEAPSLKQAQGGVSLKCTPTETGIEKPICIC
jgi:hypothetical protein